MKWKRVSKDELLKTGEKYQFRTCLSGKWESISKEKLGEMINVIAETIRNKGFKITTCELTPQGIVLVQGTFEPGTKTRSFQPQSLLVSGILLIIFSGIVAYSLTIIQQTAYRLVESPGGIAVGLGTLAIIGFGLFFIIRK
jgi:hypothetical protein